MELEEIIRNVHQMSDEGIEMLRTILKPRHVSARSVLVRQGEVSNEVMIIKEGIARNYSLFDGKETTRWFATPGDVIASMFSFVRGEPAMSSIKAITDMRLLVADASDIKSLITTSPEWAFWTSSYLIDGLYQLERRFQFLGEGDACTRYQNLLKYRTQEVLNSIPLQYVAQYLNIIPQTLSRLRRITTGK